MFHRKKIRVIVWRDQLSIPEVEDMDMDIDFAVTK